MSAAKAKTKPQPFYDVGRPACNGKWVSVHRHSEAYVELRSHHTEHEARKAMGLHGGNRDPKYVPEIL